MNVRSVFVSGVVLSVGRISTIRIEYIFWLFSVRFGKFVSVGALFFGMDRRVAVLGGFFYRV